MLSETQDSEADEADESQSPASPAQGPATTLASPIECGASTCVERLETEYRILGTEGEAGVDYKSLFDGCKATHQKARALLDDLEHDAAGEQVCTDDLVIYSCRRRGREGMHFWRLMLFVQMQGTLSGMGTCCLPYYYDNREEPPGRVRLTAWSLTKDGQDTLAVVVGAFRAFPAILTRTMPALEDERVRLDPTATAEQRLRAIFALGCSIVDHTELSNAQLQSLWKAILALCNARPCELESAVCAVDACLEHIRGLGFSVGKPPNVQKVAEGRSWRSWFG